MNGITKKIICLMGPTAVGKTQLAIELTQRLTCCIISVDSGMVYRGMDIGTAKPNPAELAIAPHRLIDICDPRENYSVGRFCEDALLAIDQIIKAGKIPLLVGGTMLYFHALQQGLSILPKADANIRAKLAQEIQNDGITALHKRLQKIDAKAAAKINVSDKQRLQRALEIYALTGKTVSEIYAEKKKHPLPHPAINIALLPEQKSSLHVKIANRFNDMLKKGFLNEVECLFKRDDLHRDLPSLRTVGYRQAWQYLSGEINQEEMWHKAICATRQLAKRQMTWLRSWQDLKIFTADEASLAKNISHYLTDKLGLVT